MTNEEKMERLKEKFVNYNDNFKDSVKIDFLRNICEYRLRKTIWKYENGVSLDEIEIISLKRYIELSKRVSMSSIESEEDIVYRATFGAGNFTNEEKALLENINNLYNGNKKTRR